MQTDIIILGGGLVGGTLAQGLALQGHKVTVIDPSPPPTELPKDKRTLAIAASSKALLERINIWPQIDASVITPIERIAISDTRPDEPLIFDAQDQDHPEPLGYMLHHGDLREAIYDTASHTPGITLMGRSRPTSFESSQSVVTVHLETGKTVTAKLLVGADGKNSWVRDQLKIPTRRFTYEQTAVIGLLNHPHSHRRVAAEHFTAAGPLAFLPMEGKTTGLVWSVSERMRGLLMRDPLQAEKLINNAFGDHRGRVTLATPLTCFPLEAVMPRTCVGERACLVGDAAHSMHPVAGQGLNVGFRDIECLLTHLNQAKHLGLDLGSRTLMEDYAKKRKFDHLSMMIATHGVVKLFSKDVRLLTKLRRMTLQVVDLLPPLKRRMMRHAMGY
jgi:2-octaprenyl-6-methoxyphenol hydroxylase